MNSLPTPRRPTEVTGFDPDYGSTPLDFEELDALLTEVAEAIGEPLTKASVYELEQAYEDAVREAFVLRAATGELPLADLLTDRTLRDLHARLYENVWTWAGLYRQRELSRRCADSTRLATPVSSQTWLAWPRSRRTERH